MDYTKIKEEITKYINEHLNEKRLKHIFGVKETSIKLANLYGEDSEKAEVCALFHDMYKWLDNSNVNYYVNRYHLPDKYLSNPNLAHSKIAAIVMRDEYHIDDIDMINAVSYHTTGRANMSTLEKILALADFIEPNRDFPEVFETRALAKVDLDKACLRMFEQSIDFLQYKINQGELLKIDEDTIEAKEYLWKLLNTQN